MSKSPLFAVPLVAILTSATACPAETARAYFRYLEIPLDESRNTVDVLMELSEGKNLAGAIVDSSAVAGIPADGKEVYAGSTEPETHGVQGLETVGRPGFVVSARAKAVSDDKWSLTLAVHAGENVPKFESNVRKDGTQYPKQRSGLVGFNLEMGGVLLETGRETVVHADVEKWKDKSVCRVFTITILPPDSERIE